MSEIPPINRSFQFPTETSDSQENKNSKAANNDASDAIEKSSDQVNFEAVLAGSNVDTSTDAEIQRLNDLRNSLDAVMHDGAASLKEFEEKLNEVGDDAQPHLVFLRTLSS